MKPLLGSQLPGRAAGDWRSQAGYTAATAMASSANAKASMTPLTFTPIKRA